MNLVRMMFCTMAINIFVYGSLYLVSFLFPMRVIVVVLLFILLWAIHTSLNNLDDYNRRSGR